MMHGKENPADVVVVGAGNAAFTAALAARRAGCEVVVLEKAPEPFRGGNTRFTGGVFRFTYGGLDDLLPIVKDTDDASDVVVDPYPRRGVRARSAARHRRPRRPAAEPGADRALLRDRALDGRSRSALRVQPRGYRDGHPRHQQDAAAARRRDTRPSRGDRPVADPVRPRRRARFEVLYERQVNRILCDDAGRVIGVEARGPHGLERHYGRAVIAASGGFPGQPRDAHRLYGRAMGSRESPRLALQHRRGPPRAPRDRRAELRRLGRPPRHPDRRRRAGLWRPQADRQDQPAVLSLRCPDQPRRRALCRRGGRFQQLHLRRLRRGDPRAAQRDRVRDLRQQGLFAARKTLRDRHAG